MELSLIVVLVIWAGVVLYHLFLRHDDPTDETSVDDVLRHAMQARSWFEQHARCPSCGRGIKDATSVPASDWEDAALGGRQYRCNKDGATLVVVLSDQR